VARQHSIHRCHVNFLMTGHRSRTTPDPELCWIQNYVALRIHVEADPVSVRND
jgi:hypothetical protein